MLPVNVSGQGAFEGQQVAKPRLILPFETMDFFRSQKALPNVFANPAQNIVLRRCRLVYFLPAVWRVDSLSIEADDFDYAPFSQRGGLGRAHQLFGNDLNLILDELNLRLVA